MSEGDISANPLEDDGAGYLISVSDMMAGLLFVFLITLVAFVINFQAATDEKEVQTRNAEVERDAAAYARQEAENARELALEEARAAEEERDANGRFLALLLPRDWRRFMNNWTNDLEQWT